MKTLFKLTFPMVLICLLFCNFTTPATNDHSKKTEDVFRKISKDIFKVLKDKNFKVLDKLTPTQAILTEVMKKMPERDKEPWKEFSSRELEKKINDAIKKQVKRLHDDSQMYGTDFSKIRFLRNARPRLKKEKGFEQAEGSLSISNSGSIMNIQYHLVKYNDKWYLMRIWY